VNNIKNFYTQKFISAFNINLYYHVIFIFLFTLASCIILAAIPGYFSNDELEIIDSLSKNGLSESIWSFSGMRHNAFFRPLGYQFLELTIFYGKLPFMAHCLNVIIHGLVCIGVYVLIKELSDQRRAVAAACIFAVSPLAAFSVGWVVAIYDILVTGFIVLALISVLRIAVTGSKLWLGVLVLATTGAILSKETWIILPLFIFTLSLTQHGRERRIIFFSSIALGFIALLYLCIRLPGLTSIGLGQSGGYGLSIGKNVFNNLIAYISFPFSPLTIEVIGFESQASIINFVVPLMILFSALIAGIYATSLRAVALGAIFFIGYLLPVIFITKHESQYLYGAGVPFSMLIAVLVCDLKRILNRVVGVILCAILVAHTLVIDINLYITGQCQTSILNSLNTLFPNSINTTSSRFPLIPIAPNQDTRWWILARAIHNNKNSSDARGLVVFTEKKNDAQLIFNQQCLIERVKKEN